MLSVPSWKREFEARPTIKSLEKRERTDGREEMVCSVTGFYPNKIAVTLLRNGKVANESVLSQIQTSSDGTYSINRTMTLQPNEKFNSLSCEVQHESLLDLLKKEVRLLYEGQNNNQSLIIGLVVAGIIVAVFITGFVVYTQKRKKGLLQFMVGDIQGPQTWIDGEKITLYCTSNCTPNTEVKWTIQDKDGNSVTISDIVTKDAEEKQPLMSAEYLINSEKKDKPGKKVCDFTSSLSFIPSLSRHLNSAVTCEFTCAEKTEQKSFKYKSIYAKPQFIEPAEFTICNTEEVQLCINLRKFYPKHIDISWSCDHRQLPDIKNPECTMNSDGTYNTVIRQPIPAAWFSDPNCKVRVTWRHVSMESPEHREFSVKDLPWHPEIGDINIQKSSGSSNIELQCKIYHFFPDLLTVKWYEKKKGGQEVHVTDSDKYKISEIRERDANLTFSSNPSLSFEKSFIAEEEVEFICRVEHPCMKNPILSSTGLLQVTGKCV
ncbi:signal-regulatory beta-1-like isoform X3 [Pelobates cultripes]|uniref:Signal-regulatory beta-1-like isoform X3 n=1 Tax=Pelobates cultripes TaxID=61616 RepID=A0AAD1SQT3_PELCU|nr:signal-regulatory beta-1-like isoform X3 [Pelobates cultripes]